MILIVGATGKLGGTIALHLLQQGKPVRVLLRKNSPADVLASQGMAIPQKQLLDAGAEPVYGDLKDRASLDAAVAGVQTVITTANSALRGGDDNPFTIEMQGNRNLIDAAKAAHIGHFIFCSILAYDPDNPNPFFAGKGQTEDYLVKSGIPYTILAPDMFAEVWLGMVLGAPVSQHAPITLIAPASHRHSIVSMRDVVAYTLAAVNNPAALGQRLPIGGPEPLSWLDLVARARDVLGFPLTVNIVQPGEPVPFLPPGVDQIMIGGEQFESCVEMQSLSERFGVRPTPVAEVMRTMFAA